MIKTIATVAMITVICTARLYGQNDGWAVEQISEEICKHLQDLGSSNEISKREIDEIFYGTINKYREDWNKQLEKYPNSADQGARNSFYYLVINHRLLLTCPEFNSIDDVIDKTLRGEPKRAQYRRVKDFVIALENNEKLEFLMEFFDESIDRAQLKKDLEKLRSETSLYKLSSSLNIVTTSEDYYVSLYDYKSTSGDENLIMTLVFSDDLDETIDQWDYKLKEELEKRAGLDELELMDDFSDIMSIPPTAPPPNTTDSLKRKGNKR